VVYENGQNDVIANLDIPGTSDEQYHLPAGE